MNFDPSLITKVYRNVNNPVPIIINNSFVDSCILLFLHNAGLMTDNADRIEVLNVVKKAVEYGRFIEDNRWKVSEEIEKDKINS